MNGQENISLDQILAALGYRRGVSGEVRPVQGWLSPADIIRDLKIEKDAQTRILSEIGQLDHTEPDYGVKVRALLDFHFKTHEEVGKDYLLTSLGWVKVPICPGCGRKPKFFTEFARRMLAVELGLGCPRGSGIYTCAIARIPLHVGSGRFKSTLRGENSLAIDVQDNVRMQFRGSLYLARQLWQMRFEDSEPVGPFYAFLDVPGFYTFQDLKRASEEHGFEIPHCLNGWEGMTREEQLNAVWDVHEFPRDYCRMRDWSDLVYDSVCEKREKQERQS